MPILASSPLNVLCLHKEVYVFLKSVHYCDGIGRYHLTFLRNKMMLRQIICACADCKYEVLILRVDGSANNSSRVIFIENLTQIFLKPKKSSVFYERTLGKKVNVAL